MFCTRIPKALVRVPARYYSSNVKNVGFIGLGNMGLPMATNLLRGGYKLHVFDTNRDATISLKEKGATVCNDVSEVAEKSETIITMLPNAKIVEAVYESFLDNLKPNTLLIDASTISPDTSNSLARLVASKNCQALDTPVSGGVGAATAGTLTFMVGGSKENVDRARPILTKMGAKVMHCGSAGSGQIAKICNNLLLGISMLGTSEAMALGVKLGMDPKVLADVLNSSTGRCWSSEIYNPCPGVVESAPASRNYKGGFANALMLKDLSLGLDSAKTVGLDVEMGKKAQSLYAQVSQVSDDAKLDFSSVYKLLYNKD